MKYKQFPPALWTALESSIDRALSTDSAPVAAFDADGTLWDTDLGETFFHYKIDRGLVPMPENPWDYYVELKKKDGDPRAAYLWLAQVLKGTSLEQVRRWADESLQNHQPVPVFADMRKLIDLLRSKGVTVYIVTASVKWAVEPGARLLGLSNDHVIGIETEVRDGIVGEKAHGIVTHKEGKAQALMARTGGKRPFLAAGNTMGDLELMETSTDVRLALSAASRDDRLFKTEDELQKTAKIRGWLSHRFIEGE